MIDEPGLGFIDSNILIYAHDRSSGFKRDIAAKLIKELGESRRGALSLQVLQEFFVIATRKIPIPIPSSVAAGVIADFGTWRLHEPARADVMAATDLHQRYGISFWDAMIVRSAASLKCSTIWSEDLNPGQVYEGVRCVNPLQG